MSELGSRFLLQCKANYHNVIRPSKKNVDKEDGYLELVLISKMYFENNKKEDFIKFLSEYQYCVNLWTAHLIIEYGKPNKDELRLALEIIKRYSTTPLNEELAFEEKVWLENYINSTLPDSADL